MSDILLRGSSMDGAIRVFVAVTTDLVNEAQKIHKTYSTATAALGRALTISAIMGAGMKNETDSTTIQFKGDGPLGSIVCVCNNKSEVRGYVVNPYVDIPRKENGKLDVGAAVGKGFLNVIRDLGLKEPYAGQVPIVTGEIAEDMTYYFAASEQTSSSVGLGVLVDRDESVKEAGGFIVQLMPDITEEEIIKLEEALGKVTSVTAMLSEGLTPEGILERLLGDLDLEILDTMPVQFHCDCSKEKVCSALVLLNENDINSIIEDGQPIEVMCHFCNTAYKFDLDELKAIQNKKI